LGKSGSHGTFKDLSQLYTSKEKQSRVDDYSLLYIADTIISRLDGFRYVAVAAAAVYGPQVDLEI